MAARENQGLQIALIIFVMLTMILAVTTYLFFHNLQEEQIISKKVVAEKDAEIEKKNKEVVNETALKKMLGFASDVEMSNIKTKYAADMAKFYSTAAGNKGTTNYSASTIGIEKGVVSLADGAFPATLNSGILTVGADSYLIVDRIDDGKLAVDDQTAQVAAGSAYKIVNSDDLNYPYLTLSFFDTMNKKSAEVVDEHDQNVKMGGELTLVTTANDGEKKNYSNNAQKIGDDLKSEIDKFSEGRKNVNMARDQLASAKDKAEKALNDAMEAGRKKADELAGIISKQTEAMRKQAETFKGREKTDFEIAQGKVSWINQATRTATINLGQADGLRKQISFGVYDGDTTNINKSQRKASLEVIQLDGPHSAVTRIVEDDFKNPIMPGDVIYTPVWQPGHAEHFAMAGFFDIDGDGKSDRQRLHDMVIANGGVVDAEMDEKGDPIGNMDINTKYIIIGERPTDKSDKKMLDNYTKMISKATDLGVTQIPLHKFLSYVGYTPEKAGGPRTSGGAGSFTTSDKKDDFRPRTPPAKGAGGGAFDK